MAKEPFLINPQRRRRRRRNPSYDPAGSGSRLSFSSRPKRRKRVAGKRRKKLAGAALAAHLKKVGKSKRRKAKRRSGTKRRVAKRKVSNRRKKRRSGAVSHSVIAGPGGRPRKRRKSRRRTTKAKARKASKRRRSRVSRIKGTGFVTLRVGGKTQKRRIRINPMGEEVMLVGNPRRKRRKSRTKARRRNRYRRTLKSYIVNPRRRHRRSTRRKHRRARRNPVGTAGISMRRPMTWVPIIVTGGVAFTATMLAPRLLSRYFPSLGDSQAAQIGSQLAVAFGGGMLVRKFAGSKHATVFTVTSLAVIGGNLLINYALPALGLSAFPALSGAYDEYAYMAGAGDDLDILDRSAEGVTVGDAPFFGDEYDRYDDGY
jgi:hypothetical protein